MREHTLGEQDLPVIRSDGKRMRIPNKLGLVRRKVLEDQSREVSIFSEMQQVFHVERVDSVFLVFVDDLLRNE